MCIRDRRYSVPFNAIIAACVTCLVLGLLCLIDSTAANALFSLAVAGNYLAWSIPTLLRFTTGRDLFRPGPFYLGKPLSAIVGWTGICYEFFIIIMVMFPTQKNGINKTNMNYACVIGPGIWFLSWIYYIAYKKKYFRGPKTNLSEDDYEEMVAIDNIDEIMMSKII